MITIPKPVTRNRRDRLNCQSPAQRAAIARSRESRASLSTGGGRALAKQVLAPGRVQGDPEWARKAEINKQVDPKICALCGQKIRKAVSAYYCYAIAHESCVRKWLEKLGFQSGIIECEIAIRRRLAKTVRRMN
jgi:hypothetical protein